MSLAVIGPAITLRRQPVGIEVLWKIGRSYFVAALEIDEPFQRGQTGTLGAFEISNTLMGHYPLT
jgi:hypothetical protein